MRRSGWWCVVLALVAAPVAAPAQDSVTVQAGARYAAGGIKRLLLGTGYRSAWVAPVRVPVLDLGAVGGGLRPTEEGGGRATESLRFMGRDGKEYAFRSVDKQSSRALPDDLRGTLVHRITQDQTAAKHPAAALTIPPILDALGLLHATPRLYVMPDDPRLGEFREKWRGRLGQLEERLGNDFAEVLFGAKELESTEDFLDELEDDPRNHVAADEYLVARLVDLWVGDWDRHPDQWRWARFDRGAARYWRPVPRDRDNVFVRYEGLLMKVAQSVRPNLTRFDERIGPVYGMHYHSSETDRLILPVIERAAWDSITRWVQLRLTDELIDTAVARLPPEYGRLHGGMIGRLLRIRRDGLPRASAELYGLVAGAAELHGSDAAESARITRRADGAVAVEITPREPTAGARVVRRVFVPDETREVRVFLQGGDDHSVADGPPTRAITVRVIGGGGDDRLVEASPGGGSRAMRYYDHRGDNDIRPGRGTADTRDWEEPTYTPLGGNERTARDYGTRTAMMAPYARWQANVGPVVGIGPSRTVFGFRRVPFASQFQLRAVYAPFVPHGYGAELSGELRRTGRSSRVTVRLSGNRFQTTRFHGFGNDAEDAGEDDDFLVRHDFLGGEVLRHDSLGGGWSLALGPAGAWRDPHPRAGSPALGVAGSGSHAQGGARAVVGWDQRDTLAVTRSGAGWSAEALGAAWTDGAPFARLSTEARMYLPLGAGPVLALRAGGEHALGDFPFQEAAFLGGRRLRGYDEGRLTGDAASWGSAELRQPLGEVLLLVRGRLGVIALADAGRVWMDGESDGDWHTSVGGGFWFETLGRVGSLTVVRGEGTRAYLALGMPF